MILGRKLGWEAAYVGVTVGRAGGTRKCHSSHPAKGKSEAGTTWEALSEPTAEPWLDSRRWFLRTREVERGRETEALVGKLVSIFSSALNGTGKQPRDFPCDHMWLLPQAEASYLASSFVEVKEILSPQRGQSRLFVHAGAEWRKLTFSTSKAMCHIILPRGCIISKLSGSLDGREVICVCFVKFGLPGNVWVQEIFRAPETLT